MKVAGLDVDDAALEQLCRRNQIRSLGLFGSFARNVPRPDSDVDVLVQFEPGARVGLRFITIQDELSVLFGRRGDLSTPGFLSPHFRDRVVREAVRFYEAT